jgi:hypothetical protein
MGCMECRSVRTRRDDAPHDLRRKLPDDEGASVATPPVREPRLMLRRFRDGPGCASALAVGAAEAGVAAWDRVFRA